MKRYIGQQPRGILKPAYTAKDVCDINFEYLVDSGVEALLIDLDGTVVVSGGLEVTPEIAEKYARAAEMIKILIGTNRPQSRSLGTLMEGLSAMRAVHPLGFLWGKPNPIFFMHAAGVADVPPERMAMAGDRYVQDIVGANIVHVPTILVEKLGEPVNRLDVVTSMASRTLMRHLEPQYEEIPLAT